MGWCSQANLLKAMASGLMQGGRDKKKKKNQCDIKRQKQFSARDITLLLLLCELPACAWRVLKNLQDQTEKKRVEKKTCLTK